MQEKNPGELIFARIHAGPVFALARIQENVFEEVFPEYLAKFLGEFTRCEYMPRLYSHPREYRKIFLANYLCIGFVPGGNSLALDRTTANLSALLGVFSPALQQKWQTKKTCN